ncbi:DoxX family protein [Dyadobacter tibetensis]|uniref:DoxX family protein n=1 Tax=Dyadobacter tibetensis TaxID=1211851 RepID=UPI00046FA180|nr:hypothetical protein [Dyadobacter tibetensis]
MSKVAEITFRIVRYFLAILMVTGGVQHFRNPEAYLAFVPSFLPEKMSVIYLSGILEIGFGALALIPGKSKEWGSLGILGLLILFLPIHITDVFVQSPAMGSGRSAEIRLVLQFILIWAAFRVYKRVQSDFKSSKL